MDGSGYSKDEAIVPQEKNMVRIGDPKQHIGYGDGTRCHRTIDGYRRKYKKFAEAYRGRVFAMSGWTRECSGEPK